MKIEVLPDLTVLLYLTPTGRRLCYAAVEVRGGQGRLPARGASTLMVLPSIGLQVDEPFPPKFVD